MTDVGGIAGDQLRSYVDRVLRLREEIAALNADVSEVYKEAVGNGFDKKTLQATVKRAAQALEVVEEQDTLLDLYWRAYTGTDVATRARAPEPPATPHDADGVVIEDEAPSTGAAESFPASVAQLVERGPRKAEVSGSTPDAGTAAVAQQVEQPPCSGQAVGSNPASGSNITPEVPSAPSQGLHGGQPSDPSPDAVPAADALAHHTAPSDSGQSERAADYDLDVPAFLKRDPVTGRAPYMDRSAAE